VPRIGFICADFFVAACCESDQDSSAVHFGNATADLFCGKFASSQRLVDTESVVEAVHETDRSRYERRLICHRH
jgi:hypothetical protein